MVAKKTSSWAAVLRQAVAAYNNSPHEHLLDQRPKDVEKSSELQYTLEKQAGEDLVHNFDEHAGRVKKLREEGGFRVQLPRHEWNRTIMPGFGGEVHKVDSFIGSKVENSTGARFDVRMVTPAPESSARTAVPTELTGGNPALKEQQRKAMRIYASKLHARLKEKRQMTVQGAAAFLYQFVPGTRQVMEENRFAKGHGAFSRFLRLFPEWFKLVGSGARTLVVPA